MGSLNCPGPQTEAQHMLERRLVWAERGPWTLEAAVRTGRSLASKLLRRKCSAGRPEPWILS